MIRKDINILGLSLSHCATACLLKNGKVIGAVSEERFNRQKNWSGYPKLSIDYLLQSAGIKGKDLDLVVVNGLAPLAIVPQKTHISLYRFYDKLAEIFFHFPFLRYFYQPLYQLIRPRYTASWREKLTVKIKNSLRAKEEKVAYIDHHLGHICAPLYGLLSEEQRKEKWLVLTNDGMGDDYCAAVSVFNGRKLLPVGKKTLNNDSLALVCAAVTRYLGMKALEHEYKVMGLAPYADSGGQEKSYQVLKKLVWLNDDLSFGSAIDAPSYYYWLRKHLEGHRFDWIAGAVQKLIEELLVDWVKAAVGKTGVKKLIFGGGVFMNVKANMLISQLPEVEEIWVMPSATDESTAIGATYWGFTNLSPDRGMSLQPQVLTDLYLGPEYSKREIRKGIKRIKGVKVKRYQNIEKKIARLLTQKKIVARFAGRMEWGARALGNRSILAHPSDPRMARIINEQIKNRDFWMPFCPTIIEEKENDYLVNPRSLKAPFMILAFKTTRKGKKDLAAAIHPYDFTCRPQVLKKEDNPRYYQLIKEFEKLTGVGAVLNTSFNLHGRPIVCSPKDALYVFANSGLEYLALENYLICKK